MHPFAVPPVQVDLLGIEGVLLDEVATRLDLPGRERRRGKGRAAWSARAGTQKAAACGSGSDHRVGIRDALDDALLGVFASGTEEVLQDFQVA